MNTGTYNFLLVDDNSATNFLNKMVLQKSGLSNTITIAKNGLEALNAVKKNTPDYIFLDINMPIMTGWQFLEAYEKLSSKFQNSTVVLMISEKLSEDELIMARSRYNLVEFNNKILNNTILDNLINSNLVHLA